MASPRVFVSHSHRDDAFTERLVRDLRAAGADVWVDLSNIHYNDFLESINDALAQCEWLVLVQTPHALRSPAVRTEVNAALTLVWQKRIRAVIPVIAERCESKEVPPTWSTLHYYDATREYHEALAGLLNALGLPSAAPQPAAPSIAQQPNLGSQTPLAQAPITQAEQRVDASVPHPAAGKAASQVRGQARRFSTRAPLLVSIAVALVIASLSSFAGLRALDFPLFGASPTPTPSTPRVLPDHLSAVHMVSPSEGWAIGGGDLIHFKDGAWQPQANMPSDVHLMSLYMLSSQEGWAVGNAILHYTGGKWVREPLPASADGATFTGISMVSSREGWAVGQQGIYHYLDGAWTQVTPVTVHDEFPSLYNGTPTQYWYEIPVDPISVSMATSSYGVVAGGAGTLLRYDGHKWTQSVNMLAVSCNLSAQGQVPCTVPQSVTSADLTSVVALGQDDAWAVGTYGYNHKAQPGYESVFHYQAGKWQPVMVTLPNQQGVPNLQALSFDPKGDDAWAVGEAGVMLHYSGGKWTIGPQVTTQPLNGIDMLSATDGWAVGDGGTILHFTGGKWTVVHKN